MIKAVGIDIADTDRIRQAYHRYGDRFLRRVCSPDEIAVLTDHPLEPELFLAGRFAAKEAVLKALGAFFDRGVALRDIEIQNRPSGRPYVKLPPPLAAALTGRRILISISCSGRQALATAMIVDEDTMTNDEILQIFYDSKAMLSGHFLLTSGRHSDVYFEKFTILRQPPYVDTLCRLMADHFRNDRVELVVGPTVGGVIIAYETAKNLGTDAIYAEAGEDGKSRIFKRGFSIEPGTRVLIVDDILTTGRSVQEVIRLCRSYQAEIVGLGVLLDRSGGAVTFDVPLKPLATVAAQSWEASECPLCAKEVPLTQRGSRKL